MDNGPGHENENSCWRGARAAELHSLLTSSKQSTPCRAIHRQRSDLESDPVRSPTSNRFRPSLWTGLWTRNRPVSGVKDSPRRSEPPRIGVSFRLTAKEFVAVTTERADRFDAAGSLRFHRPRTHHGDSRLIAPRLSGYR